MLHIKLFFVKGLSYCSLSFIKNVQLSVAYPAYSKAVENLGKKSINSSTIEETVNRKRPVPFYNWLMEREMHLQ
ncbi:hypothetical protein ABIA69_000775 [Lysinibacillus parviboronicapiens]|uniref:Uncharacterized protein n=1 Tax=Lysinibacillus parviboronicapiens TaxID=436516 RepID=A0ABV2PFA4_9BACI